MHQNGLLSASLYTADLPYPWITRAMFDVCLTASCVEGVEVRRLLMSEFALLMRLHTALS
jgi:hypothetical protein